MTPRRYESAHDWSSASVVVFSIAACYRGLMLVKKTNKKKSKLDAKWLKNNNDNNLVITEESNMIKLSVCASVFNCNYLK